MDDAPIADGRRTAGGQTVDGERRRTHAGRMADGGQTANGRRTDGGQRADGQPTADGQRTADKFVPAAIPLLARRQLANIAHMHVYT